MADKKHTIKDIAALAGVSKGTVDRVLHKRGKVSEKAQLRVERVLKQIDYQPNLIARNLKENKIYKICVLIPDVAEDSYWIPAHKGIRKAAEEFKPLGILVEEYFYHPKQKISFRTESQRALASAPDVLLMAPAFQEESLSIIDMCRKENIRVAFFNNYINALSGHLFIGQDLYRSGKIAAGLIHKMVDDVSTIGVIHIDWEPHMQHKENGFRDYFKDIEKNHTLLDTKKFNTGHAKTIQEYFTDYIKENGSVSALFLTNSKAYSLVPTLIEQRFEGIIVAYDLLPQNIEYLKSGDIDFLLHQRPEEQAYLGVSYFAEFFLFGKEIPPQKLLPIDIVTSENVDYYST